MDKGALEERTKAFAVAVVHFVSELKKSKASDVVGYQLLRSGTSVGANYREANRAVSRPDFIHKIGICEKEAAETHYWLELCTDAALAAGSRVDSLLKEAGELVAIFSAIGKTAKKKA